jgi:copper(I)-binding protein
MSMHGASRLRAVATAAVLVAGGTALAGCQRAAGSSGDIHVSGASIPLPSGGRTSAYLDIRNNGPADRLVSAKTSDGGQVTFRAPDSGSSLMHTIPAIAVPSGATLRLVPNGAHLAITGAGPMKGGTQITLTLVFAKAGTISIPAEITNSQSGGSTYFTG